MVDTEELLRPYAGQVRVRVGGLLVREGTLLLAAHRGLLPAGATFWSPPGGGWVFGESLRAALRREFLEWQALELFLDALSDALSALPRLGPAPEPPPQQQLLTELAWRSPRQLLALPPAQVHPVLRGLLSVDDVFVPQVMLK